MGRLKGDKNEDKGPQGVIPWDRVGGEDGKAGRRVLQGRGQPLVPQPLSTSLINEQNVSPDTTDNCCFNFQGDQWRLPCHQIATVCLGSTNNVNLCWSLKQVDLLRLT